MTVIDPLIAKVRNLKRLNSLFIALSPTIKGNFLEINGLLYQLGESGPPRVASAWGGKFRDGSLSEKKMCLLSSYSNSISKLYSKKI